MKIAAFLKKEIVLTVAAVLALASAFVVKPDAEYLNYIDFRTLGILFCLMSVMAGLNGIGFFERTARALLKRTKNVRQMVLVLVLLCFFFSMLITNDVALITFVPLGLVMLALAGGETKKRFMIVTVVLQTIAANLGSMLTPIGNPQNLYLYGRSGMGMGEFLWMMLPLTAISLVLVVGCVFVATRGAGMPEGLSAEQTAEQGTGTTNRKKLALYGFLFLLSMLAVLRVLPWVHVLLVTFAVVLLVDTKVLRRVDYSLLLTFVVLFVFVGNVGRIPAFHSFLSSIVNGREVLTAAVCSQVASNVPAALLLSGFTDKLRELTFGVNVGGLGTLIASMASLISYKFVANDSPADKGQYIRQFTLYNLLFLLILLPVAMLL